MFVLLATQQLAAPVDGGYYILATLLCVLTILATIGTWKNRHNLKRWFGGPGTDVPSIAAETIEVLKERIQQLEASVQQLQEENHKKDIQIAALTELVTKSAAVDRLSESFKEHKTAIMASHAKIHQTLGEIKESVSAGKVLVVQPNPSP